MILKASGRKVSTPLMFLNGVGLEYGTMQMSRYLRSFYARSNVIFRKCHHCSASIKVNLIKTYCAPYCSQLWVNHLKSSYNKLRVAYNNAYRRVLDYVKSDSNMFVYNRVENYDAHNRHLVYSLRSRLLDSDNPIIVFILEADICGPCGGNRCTCNAVAMTVVHIFETLVYSLSRWKYVKQFVAFFFTMLYLYICTYIWVVA